MRIRLAQESDAAAIAKIHVDSWRTTYKGIVPDDHLANLSYEQRERTWQNWIATAGRAHFVYVAEGVDGKIIGFASGGPERSGDAVYKGEIYAIYLLAQHQHRGIGRRLTAAIVERLIQAGITSMLIWVLAKNPSRAFYEALGGHQVHEKEVTIGGATLAEVAYGWRDLHALFAFVASSR
jgi:L-amino acid N-acyltransferase YncA